MFDKEVRAANKMLARIEDLATGLEHNKTTAQQQIDEQVRLCVMDSRQIL